MIQVFSAQIPDVSLAGNGVSIQGMLVFLVPGFSVNEGFVKTQQRSLRPLKDFDLTPDHA